MEMINTIQEHRTPSGIVYTITDGDLGPAITLRDWQPATSYEAAEFCLDASVKYWIKEPQARHHGRTGEPDRWAFFLEQRFTRVVCEVAHHLEANGSTILDAVIFDRGKPDERVISLHDGTQHAAGEDGLIDDEIAPNPGGFTEQGHEVYPDDLPFAGPAPTPKPAPTLDALQVFRMDMAESAQDHTDLFLIAASLVQYASDQARKALTHRIERDHHEQQMKHYEAIPIASGFIEGKNEAERAARIRVYLEEGMDDRHYRQARAMYHSDDRAYHEAEIRMEEAHALRRLCEIQIRALAHLEDRYGSTR